MTSASERIIRFNQYEIDPRLGELRRDGAVVQVEPQVLDFLTFLASEPGRIFSRDEIIDGVWGGRIVSDSAISTRINAARQAVGDNGKKQHTIRTITRRGFMFVPDTNAGDSGGPSGSSGQHIEALPLPDKPSIVVLPFANLSGDPEQGYFSDGITDDIITDLSRYNELFVIARHSSFAYRDTDKSMKEIARELGVQYVAEGSVQRSVERVRVSARLFDPNTADEIWAERYNREAADIFEVRDDITAVIVNRLAGQIERLQHRRATSGQKESLSAYDYVLRAQQGIFAVGRDDARHAFNDLKEALEVEPTNARAHALVGWYYITEASNSWGMDPYEAYDKAWEAALKAANADDDEPFALVVLAWVYLWRDRLHDRALLELQKACDLNPSNASYRSYLAFAQIYAGEHEPGKINLEGAMRLNPHFPVLYDNHYMRALFHLKRSNEALPHAVRVRSLMPQASNALALVAAIFASLDMIDDATQIVGQIQQLSPGYTREFVRNYLPYRSDTDREYFLEMLEKAGLPA